MNFAMTAQPRFFQIAARTGLPRIMMGKGTVLATGTKPTRVSYELLLGGSPDRVIAHGTLHARSSALERMWLKPDVTLRLANGHRIGISITELKSVKALFRAVDTV
ncbi:hypothetical protein [Methylobacterium sp. J-070]|uniref:hypothetical protein n=1 Tax=Methylobacterium sp. J-070 TaxID=2836650 RepID=UPI001FBBA354|nr:hypothetical protein [Methylobacterium sp. J-070]MCJ2049295.1 hypothetical protein [Methylobacterium sp. J-070]